MSFRIDPGKITLYLLTFDPNATPAALGKSKFFHGIGHNANNWTMLRNALLQHPHTSSLEATRQNTYGLKPLCRCLLPASPNEGTYCIRTVCQERNGDYWLSTAYPQEIGQ